MISDPKNEKFAFVLESLKNEKELLYPLILHYEKKEMLLLRSAVVIFSLYLTAGGILFKISHDANSIEVLVFPFDILYAVITLALCLLSMTLIKFILNNQASCIITLRQLNCIRQAIDAIRYQKIVGDLPSEESLLVELNEKNYEYWSCWGQHRKLPINNEHLRDGAENFYKSTFESPEGFLVLSVSFFSICMFMSPILYMFADKQPIDQFIAFCAGSLSVLFLLALNFNMNIAKRKFEQRYVRTKQSQGTRKD